MPSYGHLLVERLNFNEIQKRIHAAHFLGAPYDQELTDAAAMARTQAEVVAAEIIAQGGTVSFEGKLIKESTAIALIAYLQRMGKDLYRVDTPVPPPAEPAMDKAAEQVPSTVTEPVPVKVTEPAPDKPTEPALDKATEPTPVKETVPAPEKAPDATSMPQ